MTGITITVRVNGQDLPEYPTSNDLQKLQNKRLKRHMEKVTTTHYIEVEDGATFEVFLSVEPPYRMDCPMLGFRVFVDGDWIQEPTLSREVYEEDGKWSEIVTGPAVEVGGKLAYRPMIFKPVAVKMVWEKDYEKEVHLKSVVKGTVTEGVVYGDTVEANEEVEFLKLKHMDGVDYMRIQQIFKYRNKKPLPEIDKETISADETLLLQQYLAKLREEKKVIKQEEGIKHRNELASESSLGLKEDENEDGDPFRRSLRRKRRCTEVIDLTGDE
ncbi:hypothetical protein M7I_1727 [Glarea lozoyensis 74030]|uniref:DUF7918 domain-containing protein n=1 Tax=Glarea lozoyensis (strain ATCC 74030 / MF5533) TaxID=1104152 RepID=H0EGZ5_GLAL7|nr:hypothetical protein M7I_1727 [Glarea lozoyensis 74030]